MLLVRPLAAHLPSYTEALQRGWSADTVRGAAAAQEELAWIAADPEGFLAAMDDPEAKGPPVTLADGRQVPRLPGFRRWMWDDGDDTFAGSINLRWQPGTAELPPHCLGHIGYSVVPWKRRRGFATRALAGMLAEARALGLPYVDIRTDADNHASQRVIEANGGVRTDHALPSLQPGAPAGLRYHVLLR